MKRRQLAFLFASIAIGVLLGAVVQAVFLKKPKPAPEKAAPTAVAVTSAPPVVGTPAAAVTVTAAFQLVDQHNRPVTERDLQGKPRLVFFGFTACPDICAPTLARIGELLQALGPDADKLHTLFVTVDPERDTPGRLRDYLAAFDPRIRGLTGTPPMLDKMISAHGAYSGKAPLATGGYTIDHSPLIYLVDAKGVLVGVLNHDQVGAEALPRVRDLLRP